MDLVKLISKNINLDCVSVVIGLAHWDEYIEVLISVESAGP